MACARFRSTLRIRPKGLRAIKPKFLGGITVAPDGSKAETGLNGQVGWSKDSVRGLRRVTGGKLAAFKLYTAFNGEFRVRDLFPQMELVNTSRIGTQMSYVVRAVSTEGITATLYFDGQNGTMIRMTSVDAAGQPVDLHIDGYCDLKDVGIKYPCRERMLYPRLTVTIRMVDIRNNVAVDESVFVAPSFGYKIQH